MRTSSAEVGRRDTPLLSSQLLASSQKPSVSEIQEMVGARVNASLCGGPLATFSVSVNWSMIVDGRHTCLGILVRDSWLSSIDGNRLIPGRIPDCMNAVAASLPSLCSNPKIVTQLMGDHREQIDPPFRLRCQLPLATRFLAGRILNCRRESDRYTSQNHCHPVDRYAIFTGLRQRPAGKVDDLYFNLSRVIQLFGTKSEIAQLIDGLVN